MKNMLKTIRKLKPVFIGIQIMLIAIDSIAMDQFKLDTVDSSLLKAFVTMIDKNFPLWLLLGGVAGGIAAQGDLRTRATGSAVGASTAMIFWTIAKKIAGV